MINFITGLLPMFAVAGLIGYYFLILKPKQDGKIEQREIEGAKDIAPSEPDPYSEIINDYPTYYRQVK
jgi:hypothetical protein